EEDRGLVPLEDPVAAGGLVGHQFVELGTDVRDAVLKGLLDVPRHRNAGVRPSTWGSARTEVWAGVRDELGCNGVAGVVDDLGRVDPRVRNVRRIGKQRDRTSVRASET